MGYHKWGWDHRCGWCPGSYQASLVRLVPLGTTAVACAVGVTGISGVAGGVAHVAAACHACRSAQVPQVSLVPARGVEVPGRDRWPGRAVSAGVASGGLGRVTVSASGQGWSGGSCLVFSLDSWLHPVTQCSPQSQTGDSMDSGAESCITVCSWLLSRRVWRVHSDSAGPHLGFIHVTAALCLSCGFGLQYSPA